MAKTATSDNVISISSINLNDVITDLLSQNIITIPENDKALINHIVALNNPQKHDLELFEHLINRITVNPGNIIVFEKYIFNTEDNKNDYLMVCLLEKIGAGGRDYTNKINNKLIVTNRMASENSNDTQVRLTARGYIDGSFSVYKKWERSAAQAKDKIRDYNNGYGATEDDYARQEKKITDFNNFKSSISKSMQNLIDIGMPKRNVSNSKQAQRLDKYDNLRQDLLDYYKKRNESKKDNTLTFFSKKTKLKTVVKLLKELDAGGGVSPKLLDGSNYGTLGKIIKQRLKEIKKDDKTITAGTQLTSGVNRNR